MGKNLSRISECDKEVFFSEVKNLIKIIRRGQAQFQLEKIERKKMNKLKRKLGLLSGIDVHMESDSSDEEKKNLQEETKQSKRRDMSATASKSKYGASTASSSLTRNENHVGISI